MMFTFGWLVLLADPTIFISQKVFVCAISYSLHNCCLLASAEDRMVDWLCLIRHSGQ